MNEKYRPCVPHPNVTRKDRSNEQFGELTLRVGDETITLQACNSGITSNSKGNGPQQSTKTDNMTQPTLQKLSFKEVHEPCSSNDRGDTHEERRLQIEELVEWPAHKLRTHNELKLLQKKFDTSPNQLKVGDKVLLDTADPHIVTTTPNEEIPLTKVYFLVEYCIPCTSTTHQDDSMILLAGTISSSRGKKIVVPASKKRKGASSSASPTAEILLAHVAPSMPSYNPSRSKASVLPPSLRYLYAILAHTITGRQESTGVVKTHDVYFLWCMSQGHAGATLRALQHRGPRIIPSFIGQMSPQGILSMLSMRMIERRRGTYPPQYRLAQSTEEEAYEDIPDDVPPQHEDPPTQPPPPSRPVHAAASYVDISECLTRFE
ncbi:hypothetical protein GOBAR_AA02352 [Gossypium barbadense]|uniref:Uncharacterized protein n=1 Tax=Gossypium barbadense TaxID=3634 RepID=A0A2P5YRL8_GOSBA|nr:hypothetical protein GOBAR_AA02352 [Gossypium barbadense]